MSNWFDIDNAGWRRMNAGRPPHELVKELIQNVLDENFDVVNINFRFRDNVFYLTIEDDIAGGISNSSLITTVFMTSKEDSCLKRGRKGRGLKEFLSVCRSAIVETVGHTVEFCLDGSRKEYDNKREIGTKISCEIVEEGWNDESIKAITKFLNKIIVYKGDIFINNKRIERREEVRNTNCRLYTQIIENGKQKEICCFTKVSFYNKVGKKGWIYEMGIPVVETDIPYDIDIHQRIPLNDNRNEISNYYLNEITFLAIRSFIYEITKKDINSWAIGGFNKWYEFNNDERRIITSKFADIENTVLRTENRFLNDKARQKGYNLLEVFTMAEGLKSLISKVLQTSDNLIKDIEEKCKPIEVEPNELEYKFIEEHKKLVRNALGINLKIAIVEKPKDMVSNKWTIAYYQRFNEYSMLSYNRLAIKPEIFEKPYCSEALDVLYHELGHEDMDEHNFDFINAVTKYASKISVYLISGKREEKKIKGTIKDDIKKILEGNGLDFMSLSEIYEKMNVVSSNEKAGIRGILNRECSNNGLFERHYEGAKYRLSLKF